MVIPREKASKMQGPGKAHVPRIGEGAYKLLGRGRKERELLGLEF